MTEAEKSILEHFAGKVAFVKVNLDDKGDLLRYFRVKKSPTFAYIGIGSSGDMVYNKFTGEFTVNNLFDFMKKYIKWRSTVTLNVGGGYSSEANQYWKWDLKKLSELYIFN